MQYFGSFHLKTMTIHSKILGGPSSLIQVPMCQVSYQWVLCFFSFKRHKFLFKNSQKLQYFGSFLLKTMTKHPKILGGPSSLTQVPMCQVSYQWVLWFFSLTRHKFFGATHTHTHTDYTRPTDRRKNHHVLPRVADQGPPTPGVGPLNVRPVGCPPARPVWGLWSVRSGRWGPF